MADWRPADPFAEIRPALGPGHAPLPAEELSALPGRRPALLALHHMLTSGQPDRAALALLLGSTGRATVALDGTEVKVAEYLRMLAQLCLQAAGQADAQQHPHQPAPLPHLAVVTGEQEVPPATIPPATIPPATIPPATIPSAAIPSASIPPAAIPALPSGPGPLVLDRADGDLLHRMAAVAADPVSGKLCAALVDLTGNPAQPACAGINDHEMIFPGSLQKLSALYAAFELRNRVRAGVAASGLSTAKPGWEAPLLSRIEQAWRPILAKRFPTLPASLPRIGDILAFAPGGGVDFKSATPALTDADLDTLGEFGTPRGGFLDWLRLTMRWSNNAAASRCILALGYSWINAVLGGAGLFDAATQRGLWLSTDYSDHDWIANPRGNPQANPAGRPLSLRWQKAQGRRQSNATVTAADLATLLARLATGTLLLDPAAPTAPPSQARRDAHREMIALMSGAEGIGSYVAAALAGRQVTSIASKIGYGDDSRSHDCAIVQRQVGGHALCYAVVGLGSDPAAGRADLSRLFVQLDDIIVARHV